MRHQLNRGLGLFRTASRLGRDFARTVRTDADAFRDVERYCFFLGCPRSGHSIVGALLDAHPEMIISHELGAELYHRVRFPRHQVLSLILDNSQRAARHGRRHFIYSLDVPGAWQGRYTKLRVIGDKHGEGALLRVREQPALLASLCASYAPIRFVHVVRNPYDAIASIALSPKRGLGLGGAITYYFSLFDALVRARAELRAEQYFELRHEALLQEPETWLTSLCHFLGLTAPPEWLSACRAVLFRAPHLTRNDISWSQSDIHDVAKRAERFSFLNGYAYD